MIEASLPGSMRLPEPRGQSLIFRAVVPQIDEHTDQTRDRQNA
jgi:hypothetical protein